MPPTTPPPFHDQEGAARAVVRPARRGEVPLVVRAAARQRDQVVDGGYRGGARPAGAALPPPPGEEGHSPALAQTRRGLLVRAAAALASALVLGPTGRSFGSAGRRPERHPAASRAVRLLLTTPHRDAAAAVDPEDSASRSAFGTGPGDAGMGVLPFARTAHLLVGDRNVRFGDAGPVLEPLPARRCAVQLRVAPVDLRRERGPASPAGIGAPSHCSVGSTRAPPARRASPDRRRRRRLQGQPRGPRRLLPASSG